MFLLSLLTTAFAADPATITTVRTTGDMPESATVAIVVNCWPSEALPQLKHTNEIQALVTDSASVVASLTARSDIGSLVAMNNPSKDEMFSALDGIADGLGDLQYGKLLFVYTGLATGGDTNEETLLCRTAEGIPFADIASKLKPIATTSIALIDASWNMSSVAPDLGNAYGPTANDWLIAGMPDGFAISAGPEGKYTGIGFMAALAKTLLDSKGGKVSMGSLLVGLRSNAPLLELGLSTGVNPKDQWTGNTERMILPGGPLLVASSATLPKSTATTRKGKIPNGCYMAGGGVLALIGGSISAVNASTAYSTLVEYDAVGGETQDELDTAANTYRTNVVLGASLGGVGVLALAGGITWTVLDHGKHTVTITPTGNGAVVSGSF